MSGLKPAKTEIGKTVKVQLIRGGHPLELEVIVVERPREFN